MHVLSKYEKGGNYVFLEKLSNCGYKKQNKQKTIGS